MGGGIRLNFSLFVCWTKWDGALKCYDNHKLVVRRLKTGEQYRGIGGRKINGRGNAFTVFSGSIGIVLILRTLQICSTYTYLN